MYMCAIYFMRGYISGLIFMVLVKMFIEKLMSFVLYRTVYGWINAGGKYKKTNIVIDVSVRAVSETHPKR